jgi:predicted MFS family arabinose efflux permease
MSGGRGRSPFGAMVLAGSATVVFILPVFLAGAMAVQITDDLAFGLFALGLSIAAYRGSGACVSPWLGRLADRLGATVSLRVAAVVAAVTSFGIAATATSWVVLTAWLAVGGWATALGQPAANRLLANAVRPDRLGAAFGIKQSAPPTASMLAGFAVPLLAVTAGWRSAYVVAGALALVVLLATGRRPPPHLRQNSAEAPPKRLANRSVLLLLAVTFGLATATSASVTAFYVDAASRAGSSPGFAGTILALASMAAIFVRVVAGMMADRISRRHLWMCAGLLVAGSFGVMGLASGDAFWMTVAAPIALAGTWGFNGVFIYTVVRAYPESPGAVSGAVAPGALVGGAMGPMVFGLVAETWGYGTAFWFGGSVALLAAAFMVHAERRFTGARAVVAP